MAKKETCTINGKLQPCLNIDAPVGPMKVTRVWNLKGDVMLIQAMLKILGEADPGDIGLKSLNQIPTPNGIYDEKTEKAILGYQTRWRLGLLKADGVIDPAVYGGRNVVHKSRSQMMTITDLHLSLSVVFSPSDYTTDLVTLVPQLRQWIKSC